MNKIHRNPLKGTSATLTYGLAYKNMSLLHHAVVSWWFEGAWEEDASHLVGKISQNESPLLTLHRPSPLCAAVYTPADQVIFQERTGYINLHLTAYSPT